MAEAPESLDVLSDVTVMAIRLSRLMRRHFLACAAELDLNASDADALYHLGRTTTARMGAVSAELGIEKTQLTHVIDRLEQRKLVRRQPDPTDRRAVVVSLTAAGRRAYERFTSKLVQDTPVSHLDADQLAELARALAAATRP